MNCKTINPSHLYFFVNIGGDGAVRLLCWVLTDPVDLMKRTIHVRNTWAKRCDVTLFMSSAENKTFPTIGLNVTQGRNHIAAKSRAAWTYIYEHYYDQADYFVKTDPDTYMIVDNLKAYLKDFSPNKPQFFGHIFHVRSWGFPYMAGGPGIVLSRESVKRLVTQAFPNRTKDCMPDGEGMSNTYIHTHTNTYLLIYIHTYSADI